MLPDDPQMRVLEQLAETLESKALESTPMPNRASGGKKASRPGAGNAPTRPSSRSGPSAGVAQVTMTRILTLVDARILNVMTCADSVSERREARLELALLVRLRRNLQTQIALGPNDAVLCDSLMEFADSVQSTIADLEAGAGRRLRRLWDFNRELLSELAAFGAQGSILMPYKDAIARARARITQEASSTDLQALTQEALVCGSKLQQELDRRCPRSHGSLLDDVSRVEQSKNVS